MIVVRAVVEVPPRTCVPNMGVEVFASLDAPYEQVKETKEKAKGLNNAYNCPNSSQ